MRPEEYLNKRRLNEAPRNPPITSLFTADPSAHVWEDGRLYVYASRDIDYSPRKIDFKTMDHYHVFSTNDMVNWQDEGEILSSNDLKWGISGYMWAPDAAYKNGKYYLYYPHTSEDPWNDNWKIGVAISDHPVKGFQDIGFIKGAGGHALIDPCVFVEGEEAYLYYGGGGKAYQVRLNPDMCSLAEMPEKIDTLVDFHEAAWVFKRNDLYYLTYSDNHSGNNRLRYAIGPSPLGPWEHQGIYLDSLGLETSHGSVVEYKGKWYAFYHTNDLSGINELRNFCVDELHFDDNGRIKQVITTKRGPRANRIEVEQESAVVYQTAQDAIPVYVEYKTEPRSYFNAVLTSFDLIGSVARFEQVEGFEGGRIKLGFYYSTSERLAKLRLIVNGYHETLLNFTFTGGTHTFDGYAEYTLNLLPGQVNTIELIGGSGSIALEAISTQKVQD